MKFLAAYVTAVAVVVGALAGIASLKSAEPTLVITGKPAAAMAAGDFAAVTEFKCENATGFTVTFTIRVAGKDNFQLMCPALGGFVAPMR